MIGFLDNAPITRALLFSSLILMALTEFQAVDEIDLFYEFGLILENKEFYRFFTGIFFFGRFNLQTLLSLYAFTNFSSLIESAIFSGKSGNFICFMTFAAVANFIIASITKEIFLGPTISSVCFYYWAKHFSEQSVQLIGIPIAIKASFVPFLYVLLSFVRGGIRGMIPDLLGVIVGHLYFFFHDVMAIRFGTNLLEAPAFLDSLCKKMIEI